MRRALPVFNPVPDALDLVEIAIPCEVPWNSMPGDELVRHCGQCKQNVYNVSSYTRAEAMQFLRARACLRIYRRPDNTVVTSDCRARLRAARKRGLLIFAGALVVVLWAQICAQFVGLWSLWRVLGSRHTQTTSAPAPVPVPGQVAAPHVPVQVMGPPPTVEMDMGMPIRKPSRPRHHIGAVKPKPGKTRGMLVDIE